ncbi:MAG: YaaL family protein [Lactobacillaceae bacterium]|jgi:hypothetical protein|nr:YaaL family protein [Lactobacillaceae bacterium]
MLGLFNRSALNAKEYDQRLVNAIDEAKYDYEKAKVSELALFESDIDPRLIKAQTSLARQKYFFLLRAARERKITGQWQTAFVRPEI